MNNTRLKFSNLLTEDFGDNDKQTINKIVTFFRNASASTLETAQAKQLKAAFSKLIPDFDNVIKNITTSLSIQKERITNDDDFYKSILNCIGAPPTNENMKFMYAWRQAEGASAKNNPFNTTMQKSDSTSYNSAGVKNYKSKEDGIQATCDTLKLPYYTSLVSQLKSGNYTANELAKNNLTALKKWGTGDLLLKVTNSYENGSTPKPPAIAS